MGKNPLNYRQNSVLGNLSLLGKLSIWAKNLWAKCIFGQIVILGMKSLGKMLPWAIYLWAFWKVGHFNFQSSIIIRDTAIKGVQNLCLLPEYKCALFHDFLPTALWSSNSLVSSTIHLKTHSMETNPSHNNYFHSRRRGVFIVNILFGKLKNVPYYGLFPYYGFPYY